MMWLKVFYSPFLFFGGAAKKKAFFHIDPMKYYAGFPWACFLR